ncbi:hypothetical protein DPSP01_003889 [Paraphaeosphaeria sporulosa]|uniref:Urease accessory protein UreD n=1 Tax=Paraphaeosphaeria sporulosa TaxID=1460663 RepID=A0A177C6D5_9PLEO|nr:uncharacterized protein CC84DRAFT_1125037 [Paraphaeosphaeria sporulosa]OAG02966.1 hypothetical protein CC84DRAFT_1125037 [Paraphaeosphaeria sporulosa]
MPHKHKRKAEHDANNFDLPPSVRAAPLPVGKVRTTPAQKSKKRKTTHVQGYGTDDTPKAFARLMAFSANPKRRSGLDDGKKSKKPKSTPKPTQAGAAADTEQKPAPNSEAQPDVAAPALKIMPGESLSDFRQRVNQALPLSGISKSGKKTPGLGDHRVTKHERHLKRLQEGWRKEEARIREKEMEAAELAEEEQDELDAMWEDKTQDLDGLTAGAGGKKKKASKRGKKRRVVGEVNDKEEDEWEALRRKREEGDGKRKGLHDVVQEPPSFTKVPREIFKVKGGAKVNVGNVPNSAGSLRKREELGEERQGIIETYRRLMAQKRGEQQAE